MSQKKYRLDTDSLKIVEYQPTTREKILHFLSVIASGLFFAGVVIAIAYTFFESPKEKILKREIAQYKLQYKILNERIEQLGVIAQDLQERDDDIYRVIFEAEPVSRDLRKAGYGGSDKYARLAGYQNSDLLISTTQKVDQLAAKMYVQSKSFDDVFRMAKNKEKMLAALPAIQPVSNKSLKRISSYYGYRTDPFYKVRKFHEGIDFSAPTGTPIYATGNGRVSYVHYSNGGYGNRLEIDHGFNYKTVYAHLSKFAVKKGEKVRRGQIIGYVGNTGKSTAPHLHYEVRKNNRPVNPIYYFFNDITPEEFETMVALSRRPSQSMD